MDTTQMVAQQDNPENAMKFILARQLFEQIRVHAAKEAPLEACGLIAGFTHSGQHQGLAVYPIENILHSNVRYRMHPLQQLEAFHHIEVRGMAITGIYHSHPGAVNQPSATDIEEATYPEAAHLILSDWSGEWQCRVFIIQDKRILEIPLIME